MHWAIAACALAALAGMWQAARISECGALLEDRAQLTSLLLVRLALKDSVLCVGECPAAMQDTEAVFKRTFGEAPAVTRVSFEVNTTPSPPPPTPPLSERDRVQQDWAKQPRRKLFDHVLLAAQDLYNSSTYRLSLANTFAASVVSRALRPGGTLTVVDLAVQNEEHKWILALCEAENMRMRSRLALSPTVPYRWLHEALHAAQRVLATFWPQNPSVLRCARARAQQAAGASRLFVLTFEKQEGLLLQQGSCLGAATQAAA